MSVVANTTVISNFASIGQLDLLRQLYRTIQIPSQVYTEIESGRAEGYQFYEGIEALIYPLRADGWIQLIGIADEQELRTFAELPSRLGIGEKACIAIAHRRGWLLLTDDKAARQEARRRTIPISGSVGSLVLGIERYLWSLDQANGWLDEMINWGYRAPVQELSSLLANG